MKNDSFGGLSPPINQTNPIILASFDARQFSTAFSEGVSWGVQLGTAILGMMLIGLVLSVLIRKI